MKRSARWWVSPVVGGLAFAAVVLGIVAVARAVPSAPSIPALPAASAPIQNSVPPYYVAIITDRPLSQYGLPASVATVRDTATGKVLATVRPPSPYIGFSEVSGASDDRTFVLLADTRPAFLQPPAECFYLLRINPLASSAARRASLTALPARFIYGGNDVATMALSPDGRALATILTPSQGSPDALPEPCLAIDYLATGTTRTWARKFRLPDGPVTLTWAQNGKRLAFTLGPGLTQLRRLDVHAPGNDAQANSEPFLIQGVPSAYWYAAAMTPDAKSALSATGEIAGGGPLVAVFGGLVRYSAKTGKLTTVNRLTFSNGAGYEPYGTPMPDDVVWTSYNGGQAIVLGTRPGPDGGRVHRNALHAASLARERTRRFLIGRRLNRTCLGLSAVPAASPPEE